MSEENFKLNNPLIFFLVRNISIICDHLNNNNTTYARRRLRNLVDFLDPTIKEALKDDIAALKRDVFPMRTVDSEYDRILNNIIDALYKAGYFSPQTSFGRPTK